jgi:hypothetical protein
MQIEKTPSVNQIFFLTLQYLLKIQREIKLMYAVKS